MKNYVKVFAPILLAILIGLPAYIFAQSERGNVGLFPQIVKREVGESNFEGNRGRGFLRNLQTSN